MCQKLGKKHHQYVGSEGLERQKKERSIRNPKTPVARLYRVRLLNDCTYLRDKYWNPQCNNPLGIQKKLKPSKAALYAKLEKYLDRA